MEVSTSQVVDQASQETLGLGQEADNILQRREKEVVANLRV